MTTILFKNAALFDGTTPHLRPGCHVAVEGDRIVEVSDTPIATPVDRTVDLAGKTLMPGLIDAHFHAIAVDPDIRRIEHMAPSMLAIKAAGLLEDALMRGFTTIRDAAGADYGLAKSVESGLIKGPRLFFAGKALSQSGGHGDFSPFEPSSAGVCHCCRGASLASIADGVDEVRRAARQELRRGATQIKIMASGGVASPTDPIWNLQYSEDEIRAAVWEATSWRTYVMAHAYTPEAIARCVSYGVRTIEHANLIDEATARHCAAHGAFVVPTLVTYEAMTRYGAELGLPAVSLAKLSDVTEAGLGSLEILKRAGVKVGLGTDLLGEMHRYQSREFTLRAEVLSPFEVLTQALTNNAEVLQRSGELGVVAPGALADLLVVDGDPLADIGVLERHDACLRAIVKGGVFHKDTLG
ncbi:MAG: amidohydrolase family protein [Alphaproteobacteria bacterium]